MRVALALIASDALPGRDLRPAGRALHRRLPDPDLRGRGHGLHGLRDHAARRARPVVIRTATRASLLAAALVVAVLFAAAPSATASRGTASTRAVANGAGAAFLGMKPFSAAFLARVLAALRAHLGAAAGGRGRGPCGDQGEPEERMVAHLLLLAPPSALFALGLAGRHRAPQRARDAHVHGADAERREPEPGDLRAAARRSRAPCWCSWSSSWPPPRSPSRSRSCCSSCAASARSTSALHGPEGLDGDHLLTLIVAPAARRLRAERPRRQPRAGEEFRHVGGLRRCRSSRSLADGAVLPAPAGRRTARRCSRPPTPGPDRRARLRHRLLLRPAERGDGADRHRRGLADPRVLDRLHEGRRELRALLRLPQPLPVLHAAAGAGPLAARALRRLGGRGPRLLPADRLLVRGSGQSRGRQEGLHHQPRGRRRLPARHVPALPRARHAGHGPDQRGIQLARAPAVSASLVGVLLFIGATRQDRRRSRCTSGCPTRWRARRRSRR